MIEEEDRVSTKRKSTHRIWICAPRPFFTRITLGLEERLEPQSAFSKLRPLRRVKKLARMEANRGITPVSLRGS